MNNIKYIFPTIKQLDSIEKVNEFFEENSYAFSLTIEDSTKNFDELLETPKNIVIGEPGIGKTELLQQLHKLALDRNAETLIVELRQFENDVKKINEFIEKQTDKEKFLFLDGLDEVAATKLSEVFTLLQKLAESNIKIYVSCRKSFADKYVSKFHSAYRYIAIAPLKRNQLYNVLIDQGYHKEKVENLLSRLFSSGHQQIVLQIPRYFLLFLSYLKNKGIDQVVEISRNTLFEEFILEKLKIEDERNYTSDQQLKFRVLEKLALVMEIYQVNSISEDQFLTFLDDLKSDIKDVAVNKIGILPFWENSILKHDPINKQVYFENAEFQEYLAAKELSRFEDPIKTISALAVSNSKNSPEIFPSWMNTFVFFSESFPSVPLLLMQYSGIKSENKIVDESFFNYLARIDSKTISTDDKEILFQDIFEYYQRNKIWLPSLVAIKLPEYFSEKHLATLHVYAEKDFGQNKDEREVQLGNLAFLIGGLIEKKKLTQEEINYWKNKLLSYVSEPIETGVLQRHALYALGEIGDSSAIEQLPDLTKSLDELVARAFIETCAQLNPNHPKTIDYIVSSTKNGERIQAHSAMYEVKEKEAVKLLIKKLVEDNIFLKKFIHDFSIFKKDDVVLVNNFESVFDEEINGQLKKLLVKCLTSEYAWDCRHSEFIIALIKLLKNKNPKFFEEIIPMINEADENSFYYTSEIFSEVIEEKDVPNYIDAFKSINKDDLATHVFQHLRWKEEAKYKSIYEEGRKFFPNEYAEWEKPTRVPGPRNDAKKTYKKFLFELEPEPGQYMSNVFATFSREHKKIEPFLKTEDKERLEKLITGTIFKFIEPTSLGLTFTSETEGAKSYTINSSIIVFRDAIGVAKILNMPIQDFRQKLISFIPFALPEELREIFDLVGEITDEEIAPVINVYKEKTGGDLWKYEPESFIETVRKYDLKSAAPILKQFVHEEDYRLSVRIQAVEALGRIYADKKFLQEVFEKYKNNKQLKKLAEAANAQLISKHEDKEAVEWRISEIIERCGPFQRQRGVHSVGAFEHEIEFGNEFAKPLMEFRNKNFIEQYLNLLKKSFAIWGKGSDFNAYAQYIWNIVNAYFQNLKDFHDFTPLEQLENEVVNLKNEPGANWFSTRIPALRRQYLEAIEKPQNISQAVEKYNKAKEKERIPVTDESDLFQLVNKIINEDIRNWVEGDGAYKLITEEKLLEAKAQPYEKLVQKTIKNQIELCLMKKGIDAVVNREPDNMDDKKVDFIIRYGLIGPIILEVKLTKNSDLKVSSEKLQDSKSFKNMEKYMKAHGAKYGIFLVMKNDDIEQKKLSDVQAIYETINGVKVKVLDCTYESQENTKNKKKSSKETRIKRKIITRNKKTK